MGLPNVNILIQNGALGSVGANQDGIAGLVLTGLAVNNKIQLNDPRVVYNMNDVEALGITKTGDNASAYRHISEFYQGYRHNTGSDTAELYIMLKAHTSTLEEISDVSELAGASKLLNYAKGRIRLLGISRTPEGVYTPVLTGGVDQDCLDALPKAQELANAYAVNQSPLRVLVEGRGFLVANIGSLADLKLSSFNRVGMVLWSTAGDGSSSVAYALGLKAGLPVQRKISRVKNGALSLKAVYVGDTKIENMSSVGAVHDKGYIVMRTYPTRAGYFPAGEPMATADTDDFAVLSRGCIIDKAQRIAYDTFLDELEDDVQVDEAGQLLPGYKLYLENRITRAIELQMADALSSVDFSIPEGQNILSNNTTEAILKITPVGYQSNIIVSLGFQNPAL